MTRESFLNYLLLPISTQGKESSVMILKMTQKIYHPSEELVQKALMLSEPELKKFESGLRSLTASYLPASSRNGGDKKACKKALEDAFYGTVAVVSRENLAGSSQVPENPRLTIITDSRDKFSKTIGNELRVRLVFENADSFLTDWSREFHDYVSQYNGFKTLLGRFYLESERVYFRTEES